MGIYERPDSPQWWMLLEDTGPPPIRESTGVPKAGHSAESRKARKIAAEEIYRARMTQLARGRAGLEIESDETFEKFSAWYETHHTAKHRGAGRERYALQRLRAFFGPMRLANITKTTWQEYTTERVETDKVSAGTVNRERNVLQCILEEAVGLHISASPLTKRVKRLRVVKVPKRTITAAEERAFVKALAVDPEIRDMYLVGVGTLLRQANLLSLRRREYKGTKLALEDSKTGPYEVPLTGPTELQARAAVVLRSRLPKDPSGYFFPEWQAIFSSYADPGHPRVRFLRTVKAAAQAAGLPWGLRNHGIVWHTATRATGATRLLRDYGVDVRTVQLIGNWKSLDQMADYLGIDMSVMQPVKPRERDVIGKRHARAKVSMRGKTRQMRVSAGSSGNR